VTVGAAIDWLTARDDVDGERIGLLGPSLGGYYGVRAAAREPRVAALGLMGAIWDFGGNVRRMLGVDQGAAELPSVPELAEALQWFFGVSSVAEVVEATAPYKVEDLIGFGTLSREMAELLRACVEARLNIIVSGGTGTGP
jgi:dienelactone hydrolase